MPVDRPRPPPIRPAQVRRLRRRLAVVQSDGERLASFLRRETQYYWWRAQSLESELAEVKGRLRIADRQLDSILRRWGITRPLSTARGPRPGGAWRRRRRLARRRRWIT